MPIIHDISHRVRIDAATLRDLAKAPDGADVTFIAGEIVIVWNEPEAAPPEKPAKGKAKKEEPAAPPAEIPVDWTAAIKDQNRPGAADIKRAEEEIGGTKVAEVRAKLSIGAAAKPQMIALQSNAREYFDALKSA